MAGFRPRWRAEPGSPLRYTRLVESEGTSESFSRSEIRRILGVNENRLRAWERIGLAETKETYSFADLVSLTTLQGLSENDIPPKRVRDALHHLRLRLAHVRYPLHELKIIADGRRIAVELPGERMEAITGQMLFDFEADGKRPVTTLEPSLNDLRPDASEESSEFWFQYALELESSGARPEEIIAIYSKVLETKGDAAGAWVNIGTLQYRDGQLENAERSYREALRAYPEYALAHFNLGNICEETGRLEEAAEHYERALEYRRDYADAHYNLALVQERRKRFLSAAKHWQAYLNLDTASPWANVARRKSKHLLQASGSGPGPAGTSLRKPLRDRSD